MEPRRATADALRRLGVAGADVLLAVGKAAGPMADAAEELPRPPRRGRIVVPRGGRRPTRSPLPLLEGEHPVPGPGSFAAGRALLEVASTVRPGETVLCLWSGGGSALVEAPVDGVSEEDLRHAGEALLRAPLPIDALNALRAAVSRLKGGRLAARMGAAARLVNVVLSDVPGHPLAVVASGPTMPQPPDASATRALAEARRHVALPPRFERAVASRREPPGVAIPPIETALAADVDTARRAVCDAAAVRGVPLRDLPGYARGEARSVGRRLARDAPALAAGAAGLVWGGETTVRVRGQGVGGRNQELVLGAMGDLGDALVASLATDGVDGRTDAAGAFADPAVVAACAPGEVASALARNDADPLLRRLGARFTTGPTGTNVADLILWLGPRVG